MLKKIIAVAKKITFAFLFIYAFNKLAVSINIIIPLNFITVGLVSVLGVPALFMLVLFSIFYVWGDEYVKRL